MESSNIEGEMSTRFSFIKQEKIQENKEESDKLVASYRSDANLPALEAVAAVTYSQGLNLTLDDYRGKLILDAGSGFGKFKNALANLSIEANVINYDDKESWGRQGNVDVQGKLERMPFADNTFDVTVASYAIPFDLDETVDSSFMAQQIEELVRVTKDGGMIRYRPLRMFHSHISKKGQAIMDSITMKALESLEKIHIQHPDIKMQITKAMEDDGLSFDEILEINK